MPEPTSKFSAITPKQLRLAISEIWPPPRLKNLADATGIPLKTIQGQVYGRHKVRKDTVRRILKASEKEALPRVRRAIKLLEDWAEEDSQ